MTDEPINLVLELLRVMRSDIGELRRGQAEVLVRLSRIEAGQARMRGDQASDAETVAHVQAQVDALREQIDRINRRLDIVEPSR